MLLGSFKQQLFHQLDIGAIGHSDVHVTPNTGIVAVCPIGQLTGNEFDMAGIAELKTLLGGE